MTSTASVTSAPASYPGFTAMPIGEQWRAGHAGKTGTDTDPWSGDTLTEIPLADADDLDEAFLVAEQAQRDWAARPPADRAAVMLAAAAPGPRPSSSGTWSARSCSRRPRCRTM